LRWLIVTDCNHARVRRAVFADPVPGGVPWPDIESRLRAVGAELGEGRGARMGACLHAVRAVCHRPHPRKEARRGAVRALHRFLMEADVVPP
jgi:hypothetical protein